MCKSEPMQKFNKDEQKRRQFFFRCHEKLLSHHRKIRDTLYVVATVEFRFNSQPTHDCS